MKAGCLQAVPPPRMNAAPADALRKNVKPFRILPAAAKTRVAPLHSLSTCSHPYRSKQAFRPNRYTPNPEHRALFTMI